MNIKSFLAGTLAGLGLAAIFMPRMVRNIIEETNLVNENGHIDRHQKTMTLIKSNHEPKQATVDSDHS